MEMGKKILPGKDFKFRTTITNVHLPVIVSGIFMNSL
jgi:hypothetical protein